ncbi:UNVERIFIED_CONTAM: hypothetical protein Slati_2134700 [Sesamum latifolium]|uniref:Transposase n=1 Tax=Sesamum latifolium TaxID=2727402 RepID=A0AAW2WVJ4_9LAMI
MIRDLGLPIEKIHACKNGCMLYWKEDIDMEYCKFCDDPRYKPTRNRKIPAGMCMNFEYMFLVMVILGPSNPKRLIDVYLKPLIDELLQLWHVGVRMHDHATNHEFMMRVALMWTVNDLPAYRMASGWSTAGIMGLPVCMDDTRAFHLQHQMKTYYFDCHRQFRPQDHLYRRNKKKPSQKIITKGILQGLG